MDTPNRPTRNIFCAKCQMITPHTGMVDQNGEFLFECQNLVEGVKCDRFIKFAADVEPVQFAQLVVDHQEVNVGQVSMEGQEKKLAELFTIPDEAPVVPEAPVVGLEANDITSVDQTSVK